MTEASRPQPVTDPDFPDLVGMVGGPMIPCKVTEITATMAPTERVEATGDLDAHYEQTKRYVIRYQPKPIEITYMAGVSDEEIEQAKQAVLEAALELVDEQQQPPGRVPTVTEGGEYSREHRYSPEHRYVLRAYRQAHGQPTVGTGMPTAVEVNGAVTWWNQRQAAVEVTTGEPDVALYFVCQNRHPLAVRTTTITENGVRRAVHHEIVCPACEADGITEVRLPDLDESDDDD